MLEGVRVVELGTWVAGPAAAGILADWGAEVVKIEPPGGDPFRSLFARLAGMGATDSPPFDLDNRGKRSIVVDLSATAGADVVRRVIAGADVLVTNLRVPALERAGLMPEALLADLPGLVIAAITGFGPSGVERDRPAYDLGAFWARSGAGWLSVPDGQAPPLMRGGMGDHVTALTAVAGIAAALWRKERTGAGGIVDVSLLRTGAYVAGWDLSTRLHFGKVAATPERTETINPVFNTYRTADGRWLWLIGLEADRHWPKVVEALGHPSWVDDERYDSARGRRHHATELVGRLDAEFGQATLEEWAPRLDAVGVWWERVNAPDDVVADPQVAAAGVWTAVPTPDGATVPAVATPVGFRDDPARPRGPVPTLGQHTDEVLAELGMGADAIADLRASGIVA